MERPWTNSETPRELAELFLKACALGAPCGDLTTGWLTLWSTLQACAWPSRCWPKEYQIARAIELAARVLDMTGAEASSQQETCG